MQPNVTADDRPGLHLLSSAADGTAPATEGRNLHPAFTRRTKGVILYIGGPDAERILFSRMASRWEGVEFLVTGGGPSTLPMAKRRRPHLVVLDVRRLDDGSAHLVSHLRRRVLSSRASILVLAHTADPRERARFIWAGASAYLTKPLNIAEVDRTVLGLLELAALR